MMKKLLFLFSAVMLMFVSPAKAETTQTLIINGVVVSKVVTKITFKGDLAILTFSDATEVSEDMGNVVLSFSDSPTAINGISAFQLQNPVGGTIDIQGLADGTLVQIFDATGKQVAATYDTTINVSSLMPGMYILKAGNQVVKFVKQ